MVRAGAFPLGFAPSALVLLEDEHYNSVLNNSNNEKISTSALSDGHKESPPPPQRGLNLAHSGSG